MELVYIIRVFPDQGQADMNFLIRPYQPSDEQQVRRLCFETALYGRPIQPIFDDEAFISEMWLSYYWQFEPDLFWVAADEQRVLGYLTGSADTRQFQRRYLRRIIPSLLKRFYSGRHWRNPLFWVILRQWRTILANAFRPSHGLLRDYPAHGHVNVAAESRGQGVGLALLNTFLQALKSRQIRGVHVATATSRGARLFKKAGFSKHRILPAIRIDAESPSFTEILVKDLHLQNGGMDV
jgi:ribosomal protein S18 acetylase RimI-like enzyme